MSENKIDITKIDPNFSSPDADFENTDTYNAMSAPFEIKGVYFDGEKFARLPREIADGVNESVEVLYSNTSGGRIRFRTDSERITLTALLPSVCSFPHMPKSGTSCFDLYAENDYRGFFNCDYKQRDDGSGLYEGAATLTIKSKEIKNITIDFPLYNDVSAVYVSLDRGCRLEAPLPEKYETPVVYYGSSITQGGCASHPGNAYPNIISRRLGTNFINLGFSSGCLVEEKMIKYISTLYMNVFVYDYDHNSQTYQFLEKTHEAGYKKFREGNPTVPIIMITSADISTEREKRINVIRTTYENALKSGDKNVYFIHGDDIYAPVGKEYCTVDKCHPNDLGFFCMANAIEKIIKEILERNQAAHV